MQNITPYFNHYREVICQLWQNHFSPNAAFNFETDRAFDQIDLGLFDALVIAKSFDYAIEPHPNGYFGEILVSPKDYPLTALCALPVNNNANWEDIVIEKGDSAFHFIELFDWSRDTDMAGEFVRARLTASLSHPDKVGFDFLFTYETVHLFRDSST